MIGDTKDHLVRVHMAKQERTQLFKKIKNKHINFPLTTNAMLNGGGGSWESSKPHTSVGLVGGSGQPYYKLGLSLHQTINLSMLNTTT